MNFSDMPKELHKNVSKIKVSYVLCAYMYLHTYTLSFWKFYIFLHVSHKNKMFYIFYLSYSNYSNLLLIIWVCIICSDNLLKKFQVKIKIELKSSFKTRGHFFFFLISDCLVQHRILLHSKLLIALIMCF